MRPNCLIPLCTSRGVLKIVNVDYNFNIRYAYVCEQCAVTKLPIAWTIFMWQNGTSQRSRIRALRWRYNESR